MSDQANTPTGSADVSIFYNSRCSKCRTAQGLLVEHGIEAEVVAYLDQPPTVDALKELMGQLGITDPRLMMRTGEDIYGQLGLGEPSLSADELLAAVAANPILLERPIVVKDGRAVIARPPERLLELLT